MTSEAPRLFDRVAADYDAARRRLVPPFDAFYGAAVDAVALAGEPLTRVLDLGAGTGILAARVAAAHPTARLTLLDGAPAMLERARDRLGDGADYVIENLENALPAGPWDAIVSALAIHHLEDDGKRRLFARIHEALRPGGVFVNAEQVAGSTPALEASHHEWHAERAAELGTTPAEWSAAEARMRADRCRDVETQLTWLRGAGFTDVDCPWRERRFAVLVARRAG